jgi:integrase/recombinase XerD
VHIKLFIRWPQEIQHLKPATVAWRTSVVGGFYRTCVIDGVLEHSPVERVAGGV